MRWSAGAVRHETWAVVTLGAVSPVYLSALGPWFFVSRPIQDIGIVIGPAWRILQGEVPHRDFFQFIGPVTPYLTATWFALAGHSAAAMIGLSVAIAALIALGTYGMARLFASPGQSVLTGVLFLTLGPNFWFTPNYHWTATLFLVLATLGVCAAVRTPCVRRAVAWSAASGVLGALGVLSHQRVALGVLAAAGCLVLFARLPVRQRLTLVAAMALSAAGVAVLLLGALATQAGVSTLVYDLVIFPLTEYPKANQVAYLGFDLVATGIPATSPVAALQGALAYIAIGLGPLALALLAWRARAWRRLGHDERASSATCIALIGGASWLSVLYHPGAVHLGYAAPWFAVAWAVLLAEGARAARTLVRRTTRLAIATLGCVWLLFLPVSQVRDILSGAIVGVETPTGWVPLGRALDAQRLSGAFPEVTTYVLSHTAPGDPVVFFPARSVYNVLLERPNPLRLELIAAGENTDEQLLQALDDLVVRRTARLVVIEKEPAERFIGRGLVPADQHVGRRMLDTMRAELPLLADFPTAEIRSGRP